MFNIEFAARIIAARFVFITCNGITFQLGAVLSYSFLIQQHCKLIIFDEIVVT